MYTYIVWNTLQSLARVGTSLITSTQAKDFVCGVLKCLSTFSKSIFTIIRFKLIDINIKSAQIRYLLHFSYL